MARKAAWIAATVLVIAGLARWSFSQREQDLERENLINDTASGRQAPPGAEVYFARVQYTSHGPGRRNFGNAAVCVPDSTIYGYRICGWAHDYPVAEQHIMQIAHEATTINTNKDAYGIVQLGSDEIYKYPWGLFSEVGEMTLDDNEVIHMREWLNRGGFGVADDFDGDSLEWFQDQMHRVFPNRNFVKLTVDNPIFHTFYDMPTLETKPPYRQRGNPEFWGLLDDHGRICFVLDYNNDLGDFWEWIDQPEYDLSASTEGLRFGLDYFIYSLTH
jgi:hypothetical protein